VFPVPAAVHPSAPFSKSLWVPVSPTISRTVSADTNPSDVTVSTANVGKLVVGQDSVISTLNTASLDSPAGMVWSQAPAPVTTTEGVSAVRVATGAAAAASPVLVTSMRSCTDSPGSGTPSPSSSSTLGRPARSTGAATVSGTQTLQPPRSLDVSESASSAT